MLKSSGTVVENTAQYENTMNVQHFCERKYCTEHTENRISFCGGQTLSQVECHLVSLFAWRGKKKEIIITAFVFEVDPFAFEHLQSDVNVVDLLQAADGWQAELGRQTPILDEELHHTPGNESHMRIIFKNIHLQQVMQQNVSLLL